MSVAVPPLKLMLPGIFGPDARYYEFAAPVELQVEQAEDGVWTHRLPQLELWSFGPTREESFEALCGILAGDYATFTPRDDAELTQDGLEQKRRLLAGIRRVV